MGRGMLTDKVQEVARKHLKREITQEELRLMPYIQYVMMNEQRLDPNKISASERKILKEWRDAGHIEGGASGLAITKEFWEAICAILWEGYVLGASQ